MVHVTYNLFGVFDSLNSSLYHILPKNPKFNEIIGFWNQREDKLLPYSGRVRLHIGFICSGLDSVSIDNPNPATFEMSKSIMSHDIREIIYKSS